MRAPHVSGFVLWFTGLSGAGKTTIANIVEPELERRGFTVDHLDGDIVRTHLSKGLGFSKEDRDTNIARIGWVASRLARAGAVVGVSAPYEAPLEPELRLETVGRSPSEAATTVLERLEELNLIPEHVESEL